MNKTASRDMLIELLKLSPIEKRLLLDRVRGVTPGMRIVPGPPATPAIVYARIRYQQTGLRQWVFAPGMALA